MSDRVLDYDDIVSLYRCCCHCWDAKNESFIKLEDDSEPLFDIEVPQIRYFYGQGDEIKQLSAYIEQQITEYILKLKHLLELFKYSGSNHEFNLTRAFTAFIRCLLKAGIISNSPDSQFSICSNDSIFDEVDTLFTHSCRFSSLFIATLITNNDNETIIDALNNTMNNDPTLGPEWKTFYGGVLEDGILKDGVLEDRILNDGAYIIQILVKHRHMGFQPWHTFVLINHNDSYYIFTSWRTADQYSELMKIPITKDELNNLLRCDTKDGLFMSTLKDVDEVNTFFGVENTSIKACQKRICRYYKFN